MLIEDKKCQKAQIWPLSGLYWLIIGRPRPKFELDVRNLHIYPNTKFERPRLNSFPVIAREKNLCGGGGGSGVTVMNPKYPRLCPGIQLIAGPITFILMTVLCFFKFFIDFMYLTLICHLHVTLDGKTTTLICSQTNTRYDYLEEEVSSTYLMNSSGHGPLSQCRSR